MITDKKFNFMRLKMENENKIVERVVKLETKSEQHDKEI